MLNDDITAKSVVTPSLDNSPPVSSNFHNDTAYPGDLLEDTTPIRETGWQALEFPDPALFVNFFNKDIANSLVTLHKWQTEVLEEIGSAKSSAQHPYKLCLITCNGSGKDAFIIASTVVWFAACKIRSRVVVTSSSGVQLTSQTEGYIRSLCQRVNEFFDGQEIFRIRQRYITCRLTGSEIRLFATDEAGKAEGYHPLEPNAEMMIVVNEGKSVSEEIHGALRRCTGYNYWLEVSTPGEPSGFFYRAATTWPNVRRINYTLCPHLSEDEINQDRIELGEHSALFRSKNLALFTSLSGSTIIPQQLIEDIVSRAIRETFEQIKLSKDVTRIGLDLAAGGDENCIMFVRGNKCIKEIAFREVDTEITADRIDMELRSMNISKKHEYIFADDGGVGRSIIDKLVRRGWNVNRVMNQWTASNKKQFGNRGAENWYRVKRLFEEYLFDASTLSEKCRTQLYTRHFKSTNSTARLFLESKKEALSEGRPSPDRADALILALTGLTVEDYLSGKEDKSTSTDKRPKDKFQSMNDAYEHYENNVTFGRWKESETNKENKRIYNSLQAAIARN